MAEADACRVMHELAAAHAVGHGSFEVVVSAAHEDPVIRAPADDWRMSVEADDEHRFEDRAVIAKRKPLFARSHGDWGRYARGGNRGLLRWLFGHSPAGTVGVGSVLFGGPAEPAAAVAFSGTWASG